MTTEDDFHRILDENPEDHHTRMVFADWLQERGDPRAEGYRALGQLGRGPGLWREGSPKWWYYPQAIKPDVAPFLGGRWHSQLGQSGYKTRREADDAAEHRAEIMQSGQANESGPTAMSRAASAVRRYLRKRS